MRSSLDTYLRVSKLLFSKVCNVKNSGFNNRNFQNILRCNSKSTCSSTRALSHQTPLSISTTNVQSKPSNILHKKAFARRTFAPNSNAQALLVSGGEGLAANASFDPQYSRAKNYIRNHPVGPAVLSPILIQGLIGALVEATLPQSFFVENRLKQIRPLIVGVEVEASIEIVSILPSTGRREVFKYDDSSDRDNSDSGYRVNIDTVVRRVSDGQLIAEGEQVVWMPDYCLEKDQL